jgi:hypothetical protein
MKRRTVICIGFVTIALLSAAVAQGPQGSTVTIASNISAADSNGVTDRGAYVQVVFWDVNPGRSKAFEDESQNLLSRLQSSADIVNARVLRNLSELNLQYATYVRYYNRMTAEDSLAKQLARLGPLCWRRPEAHLIRLGRAYTPAGVTDAPQGTEFAVGGTGQIAHLGLWVPYPRFRSEYYKILDEVKLDTKAQHNPGYIGEETGTEVRTPPIDEQTPYSPHPTDPEPMSINYGEYKTFEQAEESFLKHSEDPLASSKMRVFFGSLQVPTRFYIFQVVQSYNPSGRANAENRSVTTSQAEQASRR